MTARLTELQLLTLDQLGAAATRILAQPSSNVQRVSTDEVYSFARWTHVLVEIVELAALVGTGRATAAQAGRLREWLLQLELLPPASNRPEETTHG